MVFHPWLVLMAAEVGRRVLKHLTAPAADLPPNVVRNANGTLRPAVGYEWVSDRPGEFEVRWVPGKLWPDLHLVAGPQPHDWHPEAGYVWVAPTDRESLAVRWAPGRAHPDAPHVLAADEAGKWRPAAGWKWISRERQDLRVERVQTERAFDSGIDMQRLRDLAALGLGEGATRQDIEAAFRRLAKVHHPDRFNGEGPEAVDAANRAFLLLRAAYDRLVASGGCA